MRRARSCFLKGKKTTINNVVSREARMISELSAAAVATLSAFSFSLSLSVHFSSVCSAPPHLSSLPARPSDPRLARPPASAQSRLACKSSYPARSPGMNSDLKPSHYWRQSCYLAVCASMSVGRNKEESKRARTHIHTIAARTISITINSHRSHLHDAIPAP